MSKAETFQENGRKALLSGEISIDSPPVDGGPRWGISAIFRPTAPIVDSLQRLGAEAAEIAGPGHFVHKTGAMHTTLRCFERHSDRDMAGDPRLWVYCEAVSRAAAGFPPIRLRMKGLAPHAGGVMVLGHANEQSLPLLRQRLAAQIQACDLVDQEYDFVRDLWYVSVLHFAAPVKNPADLVSWGDSLAEHEVGTVVYDTVDIVRWHYADGALNPEVLHTAKLDG